MAATASSKAFALSGLASAAIVVADAIVTGTVEAFLGAASGRTRGGVVGAEIVLDNEAEFTAASDMDATATLESTSVAAGLAINILIPRAFTNGATRAYAGDGTNLDADALRVKADGDYKASATTKAIAVGLGGGNGANATAIVDSVTEAFVGERADTVRADLALIHISGPAGADKGIVDVDAISSSEAVATNEGVAVGGLTVTVMIPTAQLSGFTRAYIGPKTSLVRRHHHRRRHRAQGPGHRHPDQHRGRRPDRQRLRRRRHDQPRHRGVRRTPRRPPPRRRLADPDRADPEHHRDRLHLVRRRRPGQRRDLLRRRHHR